MKPTFHPLDEPEKPPKDKTPDNEIQKLKDEKEKLILQNEIRVLKGELDSPEVIKAKREELANKERALLHTDITLKDKEDALRVRENSIAEREGQLSDIEELAKQHTAKSRALAHKEAETERLKAELTQQIEQGKLTLDKKLEAMDNDIQAKSDRMADDKIKEHNKELKTACLNLKCDKCRALRGNPYNQIASIVFPEDVLKILRKGK